MLEKRVETTECVGKKRETTECVGKKSWRQPNVRKKGRELNMWENLPEATDRV